MTKLPEPACTVSRYKVNHIYWEDGHEQSGCGSPLFTKAQMLQFRRDVLEEARLLVFSKVFGYAVGSYDQKITDELQEELSKLKDET
jgi:hypothetical protein